MSELKRGERVEITAGPPEIVGREGKVEEVFADRTASVWVPDFFQNVRLPEAAMEREL